MPLVLRSGGRSKHARTGVVLALLQSVHVAVERLTIVSAHPKGAGAPTPQEIPRLARERGPRGRTRPCCALSAGVGARRPHSRLKRCCYSKGFPESKRQPCRRSWVTGCDWLGVQGQGSLKRRCSQPGRAAAAPQRVGVRWDAAPPLLGAADDVT